MTKRSDSQAGGDSHWAVRVWRYLMDPLVEADRQQRELLLSEETARWDWEPVLIMIVSAAVMTVQYYFVIRGDPYEMAGLVPAWLGGEALREFAFAPVNGRLLRHGYWAVGLIVTYTLPAAILMAVLQRTPADYGAKLSGAFQNWWAYVLMYLFMLPWLLSLSGSESFQAKYPFYHLRPGEEIGVRFFLWEGLYALQFVSLEFFFRGFMLHGLKRRMGPYAILAMTVPYTMIHFGKPLPETFGAIGAGLVLGYMSLRTRSIWLGAALHIAVAWTMDAAALVNR